MPLIDAEAIDLPHNAKIARPHSQAGLEFVDLVGKLPFGGF